jgi:hypothetical protein
MVVHIQAYKYPGRLVYLGKKLPRIACISNNQYFLQNKEKYFQDPEKRENANYRPCYGAAG